MQHIQEMFKDRFDAEQKRFLKGGFKILQKCKIMFRVN